MAVIKINKKNSYVFKLAEFQIKTELEVEVKKWFFKKIETKELIKDCVLVYVYYNDKLSDLEIIDKSLILEDSDSYEYASDSTFESSFDHKEYSAHYEVSHFKGYKFIREYENFIAAILESESKKALELLYHELPGIEEFKGEADWKL